jgi:hypothetical protein
MFSSLFDRVERYFETMTIYDFNFQFWINEASINGGMASGAFQHAGCYNNLIYTTCIVRNDEMVQANCAAVSLWWLWLYENSWKDWTAKQIQQRLHTKNFWSNFTAEVYERQMELGWGEYVTLNQIENYLQFIPDHRIVVLTQNRNSHVDYDYWGNDYEFDHEKKIFYMFLDLKKKHYYPVRSPRECLKIYRGNHRDSSWCYRCSTFFIAPKNCNCDNENQMVSRKRSFDEVKTCDCGVKLYNPKNHVCDFMNCKFCKTPYMKEYVSHRCPVYSKKDADYYLPFLGEPGADPKKSFALIAFDMECCIEVTEQKTMSYNLDEDDYFIEDEKGPVHFEISVNKHVPNLIIWENVFTNEGQLKSKKISDFLLSVFNASYTKTICIAHNSAGYDTKFIFKELLDEMFSRKDLTLEPLFQGSKFTQLTVHLAGKRSVVFRDSMKHLLGSLSRLCAERFKNRTDITIEKGTFPHLFNSEANYGYVGKIPDLKYFDLGFTLKSDKDRDKFYEWYNSWNGREDWCFEKELVDYCANDVHLLKELLKAHHYDTMKIFKDVPYLQISPWHFPTSAGYAHQLSLTEQSWVNGLVESGLTVEQLAERGISMAENHWCKLTAPEYYFARKALRGGRTEIKYHYYKGKCYYIDVQSLYPFLQMARSITVCGEVIPLLYPVGPPTIEIFDNDYYPCNLHFENPNEICKCSYLEKCNRNIFPYTKLRIVPRTVQNYLEYLNDFGESSVGIFMIDFTPPSCLLNAVIPTFEKTTENGYYKCVFSLLPAKKAFIGSPILKLAVRMGYRIDKIYRVDRYKADVSPWKNLMQMLYSMKLYNSGDPPSCANDRKTFSKRMKDEFDIIVDYDKWSNNPAMKAASKPYINSMWGKHAESVDHQKAVLINHDDSLHNQIFGKQVMDNEYSDVDIDCLGNCTLFKVTENRSKIAPKLKDAYLPVAIFVPMYGQMYLYNALHIVGDRALYVDTDSIIYKGLDGPLIPTGNCPGDWENEPGEIIEFVALAPKSYGLKYADGTSDYKTKGVGLKRAHKNILNFDIAVQMVKGEIDYKCLPQMDFKGKTAQNLETWKPLKIVRFNPHEGKGNYDRGNFRVYPFGFDHCSILN